MRLNQVLYEAGGPIEYAYFPERGMISVLLLMEEGAGIEVATIGNEGMMGLPIVMGVQTVPNRYFIQSDGQGLRMTAEVLRRETAGDGPLRQLLLRYNSAFLTSIMRTAGCNGLHTIHQRCCRWILLCQDRVQSDELPMTHEFMAFMLGVRRASISEVLKPLQEAGLIRSRRGNVVVLDRDGLKSAACECYRAVVDEYEQVVGSTPKSA